MTKTTLVLADEELIADVIPKDNKRVASICANALRNSKIETIGDLRKKSEKFLLAIPHFGEESMRLVRVMLGNEEYIVSPKTRKERLARAVNIVAQIEVLEKELKSLGVNFE